MKRLNRFLLGLVIVVAVLLLVLNYGLGSIVKTAVEKAGPAVMGVSMKLEKAHFGILRGVVRLNGFVLGNPEGFKTEQAIRVDEIAVDIDMKSLFRDTLVIRRVFVKAPQITYEMGLGKSNIGRILEHLEGGKGKPSSEKPGKKVIIEDFTIEDARVKLSATMAQGAAAPIPLPRIHLTGIGREQGKAGASPAEVLKRVFGAIAGAVTGAATGSLKAIGEGAEAVGTGAGKAVGKTAEAVGTGAGKAVGKTVDVLGEGAGKVVGGVKSVMGMGGKDKEEKPAEPAK